MRIERETAEAQLREIGVIFRGWYRTRDSDSVQTQYYRTEEMNTGQHLMESLVYKVQPELRVGLAVGELAVTSTSFQRGAYDMYTRQDNELEPGQMLLFDRAERLFNDKLSPPQMELFVGSPGGWLPVSYMAELLVEGRDRGVALSLVESPVPQVR